MRIFLVIICLVMGSTIYSPHSFAGWKTKSALVAAVTVGIKLCVRSSGNLCKKKAFEKLGVFFEKNPGYREKALSLINEKMALPKYKKIIEDSPTAKRGLDRLRGYVKGGVKPVNGRMPINMKYAGKSLPSSMLPKSIRGKYPEGVPFNIRGFPDFSRFRLKRVSISPKATPAADFRAANIAAGYKRTPRGYTWHHHQDKGVMELVPTDLHQAVRHTGGNAKW